ncbi:TPA: type III toxin-antitoxin system ToxN/AbiQ family toxin [Pasteurella multocida]|nr:type III toxin-antitoxin system ToxN/AbiQ family toxin [Pasteurella multocida]
MENNTLELCYINDSYIQYLKSMGNNGIEDNYAKSEHQKPYIGIVLTVKGYKYFAPLSSPKEKYAKIADSNPTLFKILKKDNKTLLGVIRLNNMIPVPERAVNKIYINTITDNNYKNLLLSQRRIIIFNTDKILRKAEKMYYLVVNKKNKFYSSLSNDFLALEQALDNYTDAP